MVLDGIKTEGGTETEIVPTNYGEEEAEYLKELVNEFYQRRKNLREGKVRGEGKGKRDQLDKIKASLVRGRRRESRVDGSRAYEKTKCEPHLNGHGRRRRGN